MNKKKNQKAREEEQGQGQGEGEGEETRLLNSNSNSKQPSSPFLVPAPEHLELDEREEDVVGAGMGGEGEEEEERSLLLKKTKTTKGGSSNATVNDDLNSTAVDLELGMEATGCEVEGGEGGSTGDGDDDDEGGNSPSSATSNPLTPNGKTLRLVLITGTFLFLLIGSYIIYVWNYPIPHPPPGNGNGNKDESGGGGGDGSGGGVRKPLTILISLDGVRPSYLNLQKDDLTNSLLRIQDNDPISSTIQSSPLAPTLTSWRTSGVFQAMIPSFPSVTFPNHFSLITGVFPETHGIVSNTFFDSLLNQTFSYTSPKDNGEEKWWNSGKGIEPLWTTAVRRNLTVATCFWPGSEAPHDGIRPTFWKKFEYVGVESQLSWIFDWIDGKGDNSTGETNVQLIPDLITLYIPQIDGAGHNFGPDSVNVRDTIAQVDANLGDLEAGLRKRDMWETTNIVVVSDHGMTATSVKKVIFFEDFVKKVERFRVIINGPVVFVYPFHEDDTKSIFEAFKKGSKTFGHFKAFLHDEIPSDFHYNNPRVGPIMLFADMNWTFAFKSTFNPEKPPFPKGNHGYDIANPQMNAIFIGVGPYFNTKGYREKFPITPFRNVEVYGLLSDILQIPSQSNNGTGRLIAK